jgi:23S rRNA (pseudouridine1915-N3)-methyltransferase
MYRIELITIGSTKPSPEKDLMLRYEKQLSAHAKLSRRELTPEKFRSNEDAERVKTAEAEKFRGTIDENAFTVLLTERGNELTSELFSKHLLSWSEQESHPIQFLIGGPLGLDESLAQDVDYELSLSQMTFPHDLSQAMLLEQLYRAITIQKGKPYHY